MPIHWFYATEKYWKTINIKKTLKLNSNLVPQNAMTFAPKVSTPRNSTRNNNKNRNVNEYRYSITTKKNYLLALTSRWLSFWHSGLDNVQKYHWATKPLADETIIQTCARSISWFVLNIFFSADSCLVFQNKAILNGIIITLIDVRRRKTDLIRQIVPCDFCFSILRTIRICKVKWVWTNTNWAVSCWAIRWMFVRWMFVTTLSCLDPEIRPPKFGSIMGRCICVIWYGRLLKPIE